MANDHPLWISYEQDLSRLLVDLDPGDRAEVLAGVREHVNAAIADRPNLTSEDVQAVLAELGPPEAVAQEAYAGQPLNRNLAARSPMPALSKSWVPVVVALLQGLGLFLVVVILVESSSYSTIGSGTVIESVHYSPAGFFRGVLGLVVMLPMWIPVVVLAGVSSLWGQRQKTAHILLLPVVVGLWAILPDLGWLVAGLVGLITATWMAIAASFLGGGYVLFRLTTQGVARSQAFSAPGCTRV